MIKFLSDEQIELIKNVTKLEDVYITNNDGITSYNFSQKEELFMTHAITTPTENIVVQINFFANGVDIKTSHPTIFNIDLVAKIIYGIEELKNEIYISEDAIKQLMHSTTQLKAWLLIRQKELDNGNDKITQRSLELLKGFKNGIESVQSGINASSLDKMKFIKLKRYCKIIRNNLEANALNAAGSDVWNGKWQIIINVLEKIEELEKEKYEW